MVRFKLCYFSPWISFIHLFGQNKNIIDFFLNVRDTTVYKTEKVLAHMEITFHLEKMDNN